VVDPKEIAHLGKALETMLGAIEPGIARTLDNLVQSLLAQPLHLHQIGL